MKSYKAQTNPFVLAAIILFAVPLMHADKKDDLYSKGTAAENSNNVFAAKDAFCQLAADDAAFKDAKSKCDIYTAEATKTLNRFNQNYLEGLQLMQDGKYDQAEFKFRNVKPPSPRVPDAQSKLAEVAKLREAKTAADTAAKNSADQDAQMKGKLDQGIDAYNRADFGSAKGLLTAVSGRYQGDAQNYISKIKNYEAKMNEAALDAANKDYAKAASAYTEAARIDPTGPGEPLVQAGKMSGMISAAAQPVTAPANNPPKLVSKEVVKTIDVARYVADGQKALAKGDFKRARSLFGSVLGQEPQNQEALNGIAELKLKDTSKASASDEDPLLAKMIRGFYDGSDVASALNNYIYTGQGKKMGLANFYAGAALLTKYYLAGEVDPKLKQDAKRMFSEAKAVDGFKAPEKFISPKIMREFESAPKAGS